jgi:hypothetical protein
MLLTVTITPSPDRTGIWLAEDGYQLAIVGRPITVTDAEGSGFSSSQPGRAGLEPELDRSRPPGSHPT